MVFDPENLGRNAGGYQRMGKDLRKTFPVTGLDFFDFFLRAGINAVQNGLAQRAAFFIHRDAIAPQGGQANALNFSRIQAGLF